MIAIFFKNKEFSFLLISIFVTHRAWLFNRSSGAGREDLPRCSGHDELRFNVAKK